MTDEQRLSEMPREAIIAKVEWLIARCPEWSCVVPKYDVVALLKIARGAPPSLTLEQAEDLIDKLLCADRTSRTEVEYAAEAGESADRHKREIAARLAALDRVPPRP